MANPALDQTTITQRATLLKDDNGFPTSMGSYSNISTNTTTTVKTGSGFLHTLTINNIGTSGSIIIYDNTAGSGTKIGTIALPAIVGITMLYDIYFSIGLTIVTTGGPDITISYR